MSGRNLRPQMVPERGLRVVLVAERHMDDPELKAALAEIERIGWVFVSLVPPGRHLDAVRMLSSGLVDRVVVLHSEDFPVLSAGHLAAYASQTPAGAARTRMLPRLSSEQVRLRRPQPVERPAVGAEDGTEIRRCPTDLATARPNPDAEIPQAPARSANAGSEFGNGLPDPVARQRTSARHSRTGQHRRRRA